MRLVLLLLVMANLLFFAWTAGLFGGTPEGHEPQRVTAQLRPDAIHLLPAGAQAPAKLCRRVGGLDVDSVAALRGFLAGHSEFALEAHAEPGAPIWWLAVTALPTQAAADKRLAELRAKFAEAVVLPDTAAGPFVLRLATFADAEAAQARLAEADAKPPRSAAQVLERRAADKLVAQVTIDSAKPAALADLTAWVATQSALSLNECPTH